MKQDNDSGWVYLAHRFPLSPLLLDYIIHARLHGYL